MTENQGNLFATSGAIQLHFSRSMHTLQQVFQECWIPGGHGFHTQLTDLSVLSVILNLARNTRLMSIIVTSSQGSLDLCKTQECMMTSFLLK